MGKKKTKASDEFEGMAGQETSPVGDASVSPADTSKDSNAAAKSLTGEDIAQKLVVQASDLEDKNFKNLGLSINEVAKNEFQLLISNQSHGFCNFLVSKLLSINGVLYTAYKVTSLQKSAQVDVRIEAGKDIKKILKEASDKMRDDLKVLNKLIVDSTI